MKRLFIIDCYPSSQREVDILVRCIGALKQIDYDIMIVSHLPLDKHVGEMVNYVIYDCENTFLSPIYTPHFWMSSDIIDVRVFNGGHSLPICRNINTSLHLAKCLGYEDFIFLECDIIFHLEDLELLDSYMNQMNQGQKKMVFFKPEEYRDINNSYVYETLLFGGKVNYFLESFIPPMNEKEWLTKPMGYTLELSFYERFSRDEKLFYIINDHSSRIFTKSEVNINRYGLFSCELLYNNNFLGEPVLFVNNALINPCSKYIKVYHGGNLTHEPILSNKQYWFNSYKLDDTTLEVFVYDDASCSTLFTSKKFVLSSENYQNLQKKGTINFK